MDTFVIEGGRRLQGRVAVRGAKNAALPLMTAALLTDHPVRLRDVPPLSDVRNLASLLAELGCRTIDEPENPPDAVALRTTDTRVSHARYDIVKTMRASIMVLGPLLARRGHARVSLPGGCSFGDRPVDLHLRGMAALGADIQLEGGDIVATAPASSDGRRRLRGARLFLGGRFGPTVLGTANVMAAATLADGVTVIESAACEPEIVDLANLLRAMGARIQGDGSPRITIHGVRELRGATHRVIPDRIEAGTLMCAAAITRGNVVLDNCPIDSLMAVAETLRAAGVRLEVAGELHDAMRASIRITADELRPVDVTTQPHPGFPTDLQAQLMALLALADGHSVITERIFPERFLHVAELSRMGARLFRQGPTVIVSGVDRLIGAPVMASDLRASASLVIAGLAARGRTTVSRVYHLDRGYDRLEERLAAIGADIRRVDDRAAG